MGFDEDIPQNAPQKTARPIEREATTNELYRTARRDFVSQAPAQVAQYAAQHPNTLPDRFSNPINARELADTTLRSIDLILGPNFERVGDTPSTVQIRHYALDVREDLERELRRLMPDETPDHRRNLADELITSYLRTLENTASRNIIQALNDPSLNLQQRNERRDANLRVGLTTSNIQNEYGDTQAQTRFLFETSQQLNEQQQEDMLRAALMVGFAASAVFSAANISGLSSRPSTEQSGMNVAQSLAQSASDRARDMMTDMRRHLEEARADQTKMEDFEIDRRSLARLVGEGQANRIARQLESQDGQNDQVVMASVREQMELSRRLNSGDLGIVIERA